MVQDIAQLLPSLASIDRELVRRGGLHAFVKMAWSIVKPGLEFIDNWHIEQVCIHLELVTYGVIDRLVINIPPGCMKSLLVSVFWPAWEWTINPSTSWIYASYDAKLCMRDAGKMLDIVQSPWFVERWGRVMPDTATRTSFQYFETDKTWTGFRFNTSIRGALVGRHGSRRVIDDPIKPEDANGGMNQSRAAIEACAHWWQNTWPTRALNPDKPSEVIIMQRLHEDDIAGLALATGDYVHLCFPMRFEPTNRCVTQWGGDPRTEEGELLFPERFSEQAVRKLEQRLGPSSTQCQLQQRPGATGGTIFKLDNWGVRFWVDKEHKHLVGTECSIKQLKGPVHLLPSSGQMVQSWDCTFKDTDGSDYVCGGVWLIDEWFWLVHLVNERLTFVETQAALLHLSRKYPNAYDKLIEDKANGPAVINSLQSVLSGLTPIEPIGGKIARANASTPTWADKRIVVPHPVMGFDTEGYLRQHKTFPRSTHDDMVDMTSQLVNKYSQLGDTFTLAMAKIRAGLR